MEIFISIVFIFIFFVLFKKNKKHKKENYYIKNHKKKMLDDGIYSEYIDWCKDKGEIPIDKLGFYEQRAKEYLLYKKLIRHGFKNPL